MGFENFLPGLDPTQLLPPPGSSPGFAGGHFGGPQMDFGMAGIKEALAQNALRTPPPEKKRGRSFGDILGMLGDAISIGAGGQPLHMLRREREKKEAQQEQIKSALANYLDDPEGAIRQLLAVDPATAIELHQGRQGKVPEEIALMRMVGIDPTSEEGRQIITRKLSGGGQAAPNFVRELEALGIDPNSPEAEELFYARNSPSGFLLKPRGGQRQGGLPRVSSPEEARSLPPGSQFIMPDGRIGTVPGGPTATPSAPFPQ